MNHLLCIGLGYSARVLCERLGASGWRISGTSRSNEGATTIAGRGWTGIVFDGQAPSRDLSHALSTASHVLLSAPPGAAGDPALMFHQHDFANAPRLE